MPEVPVTTPQAGAPSAEAAAPAPVTREEFAALTKQINGLSAALRVVQKAPAAPAADAEPTAEQRDTLKSLRDEIERDRKAARDEKIDAALDKFAAGAGVGNTKLFKMYVRAEHMADGSKEKVTVSNGEVVFDDGLGTLRPFAELGKRILSSQDGATFLPPVETPGQVGQRHQQGVTLPAGSKPVSEMTVADMQKNMAGTAQALGAALAHLQRQ